jgi:hypothetical protein
MNVMCEEMVGKYGRADLVPRENFPDAPAQLVSWIVTAPGWHPLWSQYMIAVVSLADFPDCEPAKLQYPEATHELMVIALNPDHGPYRAETTTTGNPVRYLLPYNIIEQFTTTDERAVEICHGLTHAVVDGVLCPEMIESSSRVRDSWTQAISRTLDHYIDPSHGQLN